MDDEGFARADAGRVRVVIVDDHPAVVAGIEGWYAGADPPIEVVAAGPDVGVAWAGPGLGVEVVVFDLMLGNPTPAYGDLKRLVDHGRRVVVYSMREDQDTALNCLDIGAFTYLTKAEGGAHLVAATRAAAELRPYTPPALGGAFGADRRPGRPRLSDREIDVMVEWFKSESKELVAAKLNLSPRTVAGYIDRVRIKYANAGRRASTKAALVARAIQDGLVRLDDL
ncbi:DNA-binding response regulator [Embleya hyalina]|uniref:LuxR family transcriptional regulator n=1 Tax=Embleya hyalina TaxID=516124 RepID=A0A401YDQ0_9ACTN|nr:response regulator [Embleya hyalina]GCD92706.1 LuxR family transcriptional regulator [Embleya hyalina]